MRIGQRDIGLGIRCTSSPSFPRITTRGSRRRSRLVDTAADAGADAVKLQTYTAGHLPLIADKRPP